MSGLRGEISAEFYEPLVNRGTVVFLLASFFSVGLRRGVAGVVVIRYKTGDVAPSSLRCIARDLGNTLKATQL